MDRLRWKNPDRYPDHDARLEAFNRCISLPASPAQRVAPVGSTGAAQRPEAMDQVLPQRTTVCTSGLPRCVSLLHNTGWGNRWYPVEATAILSYITS